MRIGCLMLIGSIALLVFGFQAVKDGLAFQKPKVMTVDAFVKNPPKEGWYQLKGCVLDLPDCGVKLSKSKYASSSEEGNIEEVYVPVYSPEQMVQRASQAERAPNTVKTGLILATEDESILSAMREMRTLENKSEAEMKAYFEKNQDRIWVRKDLEGMVRSGVNAEESTRKEIAGLTDNALPNFVLMQEGWKPNLGMGIGMLVGGVVLGLATLALFFGMKKDD